MSDDGIDEERRRFLLTATTIMAGLGLAATSIPFITSWLPNAKVEASGGPVEVDLSKLEPGQMMTVEWRGKPVWILHRTQAMLDELPQTRDQLRDPDSLVEQQPAYAHNEYRSLNPAYLVLIGICTHLGCIPLYKPDLGGLGPSWHGGFYCPCHGSKYDLSGRVFKGVPAPINLEVPPYYFRSEKIIVIGEEGGKK